MAERKQITALSVITDSETSYDNIGDIDGGYFDKEWLKAHIKSHGVNGLLSQLNFMHFQIFEAMREANWEKDGANQIGQVVAKIPPPSID